jgi:phage-related tail protein
MSQTTEELKKEIQKSLDLLRVLRDEVRVQLHLASMDAKDEWNKLEPQLTEAEHKAHDLSEATRHALSEAVKKLSKLREQLH